MPNWETLVSLLTEETYPFSFVGHTAVLLCLLIYFLVAVQEESSGYPTQVVPSGARYMEMEISDCIEIYEFRSTEPYDPRNCRIPLPPITEETFGIQESTSCYYNTAVANSRDMQTTNSMQVEARDPETDE